MITDTNTLKASCNPVNLTIPRNVLREVNTRTFTNPTRTIELTTLVHSKLPKTKLFLISNANKIAAILAERSSIKINHRGTMFIRFK